MEAKYLFVLLNILLLIIFGFVSTLGSRQEVMAHWTDRRCDFDVMLFSYLYKPDNDPQSIGEFVSNNFEYCVSSKSTAHVKGVFSMLYEILGKQMESSEVMAQVMTTLRAQLKSIYDPFSSMMGRFWNKFRQIGTLASRIFQHVYMAMKKAGGMAIASLYLTISLQTSFLNSIDLVINVVMIVLYILMALAVIFFLPILAVLPLVIITVSGIESALPGKTGAMGTIFCFARNTRIIMSDISHKNISEIVVGDILMDGNRVESVIQVPGEELYELDGILVSGFHRIYDETGGNWIYVKDYPGAKKSSESHKTLWTLITSDREIPVMGNTSYKRFKDWEEIPDTDHACRMWEIVARNMLNTQITSVKLPKMPPCLDYDICVREYQGGWRRLSDIRIGSWIYGRNSWTKVIGISHRRVEGGFGKLGNRITDGIWLLEPNGTWDHPDIECDTVPWLGMQLITDSGLFRIRFNTGEERLVRDFTEIGKDNIQDSDFRVDSLLE